MWRTVTCFFVIVVALITCGCSDGRVVSGGQPDAEASDASDVTQVPDADGEDVANRDASDTSSNDAGDADVTPRTCTTDEEWAIEADEPRTLVAARATTPLVTDGVLDDAAYHTAPTVEMADPGAVSDNAMAVRAYWDAERLYVTLEVTDADVQVTDSTNAFSQDSVEVFVDTRYDRSERINWDDYQWAISADGDTGIRRAPHAYDMPIERGAAMTDKGYVVELAVPWHVIGLTPTEGLRVGLLLGNNDVDPDADMRSWSWGDVLPFKQPNLWSRLRLAGVTCEEAVEIVEPATASHTTIGGGEGYWDIPKQSDADAVVSTRAELEDALSQATDGDLVYVADGAEIDVGDAKNVEIPAGVTLASGRGRGGSEGALIFTDGFASSPLFLAHERTRVTGLRIRGPKVGYFEPSECQPRDCSTNGCGVAWSYDTAGIHVVGDGAEIDNNEIFGWTFAGVQSERDPHIHHNRIYGNAMVALGYGVVGYGGHPLIEYNWFNENRHSIAESGEGGYTARYNVQGPVAAGHIFDMHSPGGTTTIVHHNTFEALTDVCGRQARAFSFRDEPGERFDLYNNWFFVDSESTVRLVTETKTNIYDNHYGTDEPSLSVGGPR